LISVKFADEQNSRSVNQEKMQHLLSAFSKQLQQVHSKRIFHCKFIAAAFLLNQKEVI
jgi:hypothetical protein